MSRSQYRNKLTLFGLFIYLISVVAGVAYQGSAPFFCEVNGKFYREGERFTSTNNPGLMCQCQRGYTGTDVQPLCRRIEHDNVREQKESSSTDNCVRITSNSESPKYTHYTELHRCPNDMAVIPILITDNLKYARDERSICSFGDVKLGTRDFFYHSMMNDTRNCVKCICERPPKPTCHRPPNCPMVRA